MRAQRQQFGVRVGRLGPINVRSQGSKRLTDLRQRRTAPYIVFHHPGCLQGADMAITVKVTATPAATPPLMECGSLLPLFGDGETDPQSGGKLPHSIGACAFIIRGSALRGHDS